MPENKQATGEPGRTRTCDPLLRRQMLYPPELRARVLILSAGVNVFQSLQMICTLLRS